jgi:hypothetical protein
MRDRPDQNENLGHLRTIGLEPLRNVAELLQPPTFDWQNESRSKIWAALPMMAAGPKSPWVNSSNEQVIFQIKAVPVGNLSRLASEAESRNVSI